MLAAAEASPGHPRVRAAHPALADLPGDARARARGRDRRAADRARRATAGPGPDWGRWYYEPGGGALFDLGVYNVTSLCGFFGPARRVTAMTGVAIPERVIDGEPMRVEAEDNAHVLIDFGDARFAVVTTGFTMQQLPLARASSCTARTACCRCSATTGRRRATSCGATTAQGSRWELHPESDPTWPWTDGLRHLVECIETGAEPVTRPEHAYHALEIMLAAQAAGADGRAREITSDFPAPELARLGAAARRPRAGARSAERGVSLVERPAPPASSPRPDVRRPGADPPRRRHAPRLGRPGGGRGLRLDLRVDRARAHARVRARRRAAASATPRTSARSSPPTSCCTCSQGVLVIADPETGEVQRAGTGRERVLPPRHLAPRVRARPRAAARARAVRAAARRGRVERVRPRAAVPRDSRATRTTRCSGTGRPRSPPRGAPARAAPGRRAVAARPRRAVRRPRQHRAPDRRRRSRSGRARPPRRTSTAATRC